MSSDLRVHAVTKFIMPIFRLHDREKLELYCYSSRTMQNDPIQDEIRESVEKFVSCETMNEKKLAAAIRDDGIDVLMDLNGHTKDSYLMTFAYRAAPIQLTWLGYPYTSGLKDTDYVLVDPYLRPEGEGGMTESPLSMPETAYCFDAGEEVEIESPTPFQRNGYVTFGTLGSLYKFTPEVVAAWAKVMRASPGSRLLVVRQGADAPVFVRNMCSTFAGHGIEADRLYFINNRKLDVSHYSFYNEIDICLDTFPLTGGTTTCDALWMGAPVVSLQGPNLYERISYTILKQMGLDELCARTVDEYVEIATALARDGDRLRRYRETLRSRMLESPLCQDEKFVRNFEELMIGVARRHDLI
jgi:predicted O-linked N-acetylglucosamine transferase (SPINDLY family)